ncbi:hypothetical protein A8G00_14145 [Sphingobium sp. SA916]|nr:hypothetical protein A8G00_14145 [Sphingobium sp. SA916]
MPISRRLWSRYIYANIRGILVSFCETEGVVSFSVMMPKFRFQIDDGVENDDAWLDLPDLDAARMEAARFMGDMVRDSAVSLWQAGVLQLTAMDENGLYLFEITVMSMDAPALSKTRRS